MKILLAPDKFKGTLTATEVAQAMKDGISNDFPNYEITISPVADGGDGTLDVLLSVLGGQKIIQAVTGPYGEKINASYGILPEINDEPKTAIIEMAQASGLFLSNNPKNAPDATTYGTGELIKAALNAGCKKIILGLGGSATSDAGTGALQALGARFYENSKKLIENMNGQKLSSLTSFDTDLLDARLQETEILLATDVDNPFYGPQGSIAIYAEQKGANADQRQFLETGFINFANLVNKKLNIDLQNTGGSGAAGGLAGGLFAFLPNAKIVSGFQTIAEFTGLEEKIKECDLVITGEGKIDSQTARGKAPYGVISLARKYNKEKIVIGGILGDNWQLIAENDNKIGVYAIAGDFQGKKITESEAKNNTKKLLTELTPLFIKDYF